MIIFEIFLISNFRRVLNFVCFLLGNSPASEFYMPTFRNTLLHLPRRICMKNTYPPMKMEQKDCSETSAYKIQTPGNYPEESIQQNEPCKFAYTTAPGGREAGLYQLKLHVILYLPMPTGYFVTSSKPSTAFYLVITTTAFYQILTLILRCGRR